MTKIIYKYTLELIGKQTIRIPKFARILTVQMQGDSICLWAEINEDINGVVDFEFLIRGTGQTYDDERGLYVGTVQNKGFVWHVFINNEILHT